MELWTWTYLFGYALGMVGGLSYGRMIWKKDNTQLTEGELEKGVFYKKVKCECFKNQGYLCWECGKNS